MPPLPAVRRAGSRIGDEPCSVVTAGTVAMDAGTGTPGSGTAGMMAGRAAAPVIAVPAVLPAVRALKALVTGVRAVTSRRW
ncbi:hypothetical protein ACFS5L_09340 [Streptomyces phyllanthi]|uniref:Uncharacterized protein n=1 Tax=Streptomyces phyllanthi TaxID=1803180 RepID=A0A5N8WDY2_9ACTN|nr:hypothetical protein [Streptomyces phyllanthi]MPY45663.1 hypothetical protein [Streptomyces phyllanthi]